MSLWKRTRALETQVETLSGVVTDMEDVVNALGRRVSNLEVLADALNTDRDHLAAKLGGQIDELERRVDQLAAVPVPAVLDIAPAATFDGEQHHDEPDQAPEPEPAAEEPELTEKQAALVAAVNDLREASTGDIARYVGRADQGDAVGMALQKLKRMGVVAHNGRRAKGARWLAVADAPAPEAAPPSAPAELPRAPQASELTDHDERIIRLVAQHGPVTHVYVADQLVKNRRETGMRMRELARTGRLVDLDGSFATPDQLEDAA